MKQPNLRTSIYGGLLVTVTGAFLFLNGDAKPLKVKPRQTAQWARMTRVDPFTPLDYSAHFPELKEPARNAFVPLVKTGQASAKSKADIFEIPPRFGEQAAWIFSGIAVVDGAPTALLENRESHESTLVKEGEHWKSSRVVKITRDGILLTDAKGAEQYVMRTTGDEPARPTEQPDMELRPMPVPGMMGNIPGMPPQMPPLNRGPGNSSR